MDVAEHTIDVAGATFFYRRAPADTEVLYLHSVPTSSDDWLALLELTGGTAPDLPGFGRSAKPGNLDYSLTGLIAFVEGLLRQLDPGPVAIVGHGWGAAVGVLFAQRHPEQVTRLVLIDPVPLLEGFQWPAVARWLRRPALGELLMGSVTRWWLARILRGASADPGVWPDARVNAVWAQFDQGTQRAILRLHRSIDERGLAQAGSDLALTQPIALLWGERDPWLAPALAEPYARRLGAANVELLAGAGHWPWLESAAVRERVAALALGSAPPA